MPGHRKRRQFKQTDAFTIGMVIGLKRAGWSIRQIAADTHLGASTVHRLWRRWLEQGNVAIYRNVGATRVTSARVDRRILRQAVAAPQATCTAILQHVQDNLDHSISTRTISRRLVANGLHSGRPLRRLPLTPPNRRQRLEWCRARSTWMTEWHRVVFSDESRFCLSSDSRRVRVWRRRGERSNPAAIVERPTVRQRGIMVWGAIAYDSRSPLLRIQGTMTAQRYVDDVLRPVTLPYLQGVPNALYQQDNARPHTARISQQALQDVQMLPWPPYSPDLSPIEHVWDIIGRRLHALPQPCSEDELWQMVEREWRAIPQDAIHTLIDSLPRRVAACIAVRGNATLGKSRITQEDLELSRKEVSNTDIQERVGSRGHRSVEAHRSKEEKTQDSNLRHVEADQGKKKDPEWESQESHESSGRQEDETDHGAGHGQVPHPWRQSRGEVTTGRTLEELTVHPGVAEDHVLCRERNIAVVDAAGVQSGGERWQALRTQTEIPGGGGWRDEIRRPRLSHTCSMGFRSGDRAGQFIRAIAWFWRKMSTTSALCGRVLSSIRRKFSPISTDTIRRRLHMKGLYARRLIICVPLTPPQKRTRELWRRQHVAWNPDEWRRVMFTDESRFSLNSYYHRVFAWREVGIRNNPRNMVERDPYRSQCFMVWAGIFLGGRTALHIFQQGTLTGQRYRDEILAAYVMPQALEMGENFLLMDDNARPHRAGVVDTFLQNHAIARMNWLARSPDLNPIEHVWDNLGRRISSLQPLPRNIHELETALTQEWAFIPQELINSLIL
ncbi:hypothetical protein LAZ67_23002375, partial [Cordylochernes scorpioides]